MRQKRSWYLWGKNEKLAGTKSKMHTGTKGPDYEELKFEVKMLDFCPPSSGELLEQGSGMIVFAL